MLNICGTVDDRVNVLVNKFIEWFTVCNITADNGNSVGISFFQTFFKVVIVDWVHSVFGRIIVLVTNHAVNLAVILVKKFVENVYSEEAGRACQKNIAEFLKLTVFECVNIILFKNFIDICIIVVRKIFKVVFGWIILAHKFCKSLRSRICKNVAVCNLNILLWCGDYNSCCCKRCSAEVKEVIICKNIVKFKNFRKDVAECFFKFILRQLTAFGFVAFRFWKNLCVDLAVWCERHFVKLNIRTRNHIIRESFCKLWLDFIWLNLSVGCIVNADCVSLADLFDESNSALDAVNCGQTLFNFTEFNS